MSFHRPSVRDAPLRDATLWQVERDGNPLRRHAHVSPFIGKLGALDDAVLERIAHHAAAVLRGEDAPDASTLVIGMTESSLVLGWFVAQELARRDLEVDLKFTTRKRRGEGASREFREPHSHGPQHFLSLAANRHFGRIVIVEDELTTGATLRNLLLTLGDVSARIDVVTLCDGRPDEIRESLAREMNENGVKLRVFDLGRCNPITASGASGGARSFNPFGRLESARRAAWGACRDRSAWHPGAGADEWFVVGECVDLALEARAHLSSERRPCLRHVTRSPWKIDARFICARDRFDGDALRGISTYYLYNWTPNGARRALIWTEAFTAPIAAQVGEFLAQNGIEARVIEVEGA